MRIRNAIVTGLPIARFAFGAQRQLRREPPHHRVKRGLAQILANSTHDLGEPIAAGRPSEFDVALLRSEEHTSELQSLMRISYAVFCLKKKKKSTQPTTQ